YVVSVGSVGVFLISVDGSGNVTSDNAVATTGSGSTLTFNTTDVTVNPGGFSGQFILFGVSGFTSGGPLTATVVPGLPYVVIVGSAGQLLFSVDGSGNVTSLTA